MTLRRVSDLKPGSRFKDPGCGCEYEVVGSRKHRDGWIRVQVTRWCKDKPDHWQDYDSEPIFWDAIDTEHLVDVDDLATALRDKFQ